MDERKSAGRPDAAISTMNGPRRARQDLPKGVAAGVIGGLVGAWLMVEFTSRWTRAVEGHESTSAGGEHDARDWQERSEGRNATEILAQAASKRLLGRQLTRGELGIAAPLVHYGYGGIMGGVYGAAAETSGGGVWRGAAYGTAVWIASDEVAVPLLGLSERPGKRNAEKHAQAWAAHLVYGITIALVYRLARSIR